MTVQAIVFDFDGTLVDSNQIKIDAYYHLVTRFPKARPIVEKVISTEKGDRYVLIRRILDEGGVYTEAKYKQWVKSYSDYCEKHISTCPTLPGFDQMMVELAAKEIKLFINSATPTEPLLKIIRNRAWMDKFEKVYGGNQTKLENLHNLSQSYHVQPPYIVYVGDGKDDQRAAEDFGCRFIPVQNKQTEWDPDLSPISDLSELLSRLK